MPAEVDYGSEFRYRTPLVGPKSLAVAITQSGETADTLAAFKEAKRLGALPIAICNVQGSQVTREAAGTLLTHAGPEIGVASTKAFTSQIVALALLALHLGRLRGIAHQRALPRAAGEPGQGAPPHGERAGHERARGGGGQVDGHRPRLPVPRPRRQLPDRARRRPEDEGDLLHPRRGLSGGGDEARPHRAHRREHAGGGAVPEGPHLRQDAVQHPGSEGPRRPRHRHHLPGRHRGAQDPRQGHRPHLRRARGGRGVVAAAHGPAPAAHGVPRRGARGAGRRPAAEPRQVRHGR